MLGSVDEPVPEDPEDDARPKPGRGDLDVEEGSDWRSAWAWGEAEMCFPSASSPRTKREGGGVRTSTRLFATRFFWVGGRGRAGWRGWWLRAHAFWAMGAIAQRAWRGEGRRDGLIFDVVRCGAGCLSAGWGIVRWRALRTGLWVVVGHRKQWVPSVGGVEVEGTGYAAALSARLYPTFITLR